VDHQERKDHLERQDLSGSLVIRDNRDRLGIREQQELREIKDH